MPTVFRSLLRGLWHGCRAGAGPAAAWGRPAGTVFGALKTPFFTAQLPDLLVGRVIRFLAAALVWVAMAVVLVFMAAPVRAAAPVVSLEPSFTGAEDTPFLLAGSTLLVSTLAGSSTPGNADGTGAAAQFANLNGVAVDTAGNLYVSDSTNGNIRKITPAGVVTTLASVPTAFGVAVDAAGAVYTTGYNSNEIKKITSGVVTTLASGGDLNAPVGLAVDSAGNVYAAGHISHKVHKVTPAGVLTTFAGSTQGYLDGNGTAAWLNTPRGVGVDAAGNVTVADTDNHRIRKITSAGVVTTLAGSGTPGFAEGTGAAAQFSAPYATAVDAAGNVYVADTGNHRIRKISPAGVVTTLAGTGTQGFQNGTAAAAQFSNPNSVAVDAAGNLYVTEDGYKAVRKLSLLGGVSVSDADSATLTVALSVSRGTLTTTLTDGATVSTGALGSASLTLSGTPTQLNAALLALTYQGTANTTGADTLTVTVSDGTTPVTSTAAITVSAVNDAPVAAASTLTTIAEDVADGINTGTLVSALVTAFTDTDSGAVKGLAVTSVVTTNGTWQYSTNAGSTWTTLTGVSTSAARLLKGDDANYKVRFVPATNFNGTATLTYQAWDQTSGTAGSTAAVTTAGDATAFSSNTGTATVTITAVNDGPSFALPTGTTVAAGATWTAQASGSRDWYLIASSADGTKLAATVYGGQIYTSSDSGANWTARATSQNWLTIASSADGTKLAAVTLGAQIYTSTDSGATWTAQASGSRNW